MRVLINGPASVRGRLLLNIELTSYEKKVFEEIVTEANSPWPKVVLSMMLRLYMTMLELVVMRRFLSHAITNEHNNWLKVVLFTL